MLINKGAAFLMPWTLITQYGITYLLSLYCLTLFVCNLVSSLGISYYLQGTIILVISIDTEASFIFPILLSWDERFEDADDWHKWLRSYMSISEESGI